jgi:superfamily II DNA helicase RecQ
LDDSPIVERGRRRLEQRQRFKRATPREQERAIRKALKLPMDDDDTTTKIRYRSKAQGEALQRIMDGDFSVLTVVLPTAGGKTLLFTAPACLEEDVGVTIVVVPFRKLIDETVRDAQKTVGDCEEWSHSTVDPAALVIVSVDKMHDHFWSYARQMVEQGRLRRVVVDECHLLVTSHSWRPHLVELEKLKSLGVPMVMLTATLPKYMEVELRRSLGVGIGMMSLIRACTARENITYTVRQDISKGKLVEETARVCEEVEDELCRARKEKAVIYCRSKKDCEEMAERLGCGLFYAGHVDGEETLEQWKAKGGFIVSTTALSTGLNYEAVKAVIHSGLPYGLIEFAQASGRAGRDPSERVDSIVLLEQGWEEGEQRTRERYNEALGPDGAAMIEYIKTEGCRRLVLGKYFDPAETIKECHDYSSDSDNDSDSDNKDEPETDGNDYQQYQLPRRKNDAAAAAANNKAPCDKCGGGMIATGTEQVRQCELEKEMIEDAMNEIKLGCVICWMKSEERDSHLEHGGKECEAQGLTITDEADETTIIEADIS